MNCQYCGRVFNRGYNLRRHEDEYCPYREEDNSSDECSPLKKYNSVMQKMMCEARRVMKAVSTPKMMAR